MQSTYEDLTSKFKIFRLASLLQPIIDSLIFILMNQFTCWSSPNTNHLTLTRQDLLILPAEDLKSGMKICLVFCLVYYTRQMAPLLNKSDVQWNREALPQISRWAYAGKVDLEYNCSGVLGVGWCRYMIWVSQANTIPTPANTAPIVGMGMHQPILPAVQAWNRRSFGTRSFFSLKIHYIQI